MTNIRDEITLLQLKERMDFLETNMINVSKNLTQALHLILLLTKNVEEFQQSLS